MSDTDREFTVTAKFKDGTAQVIGTFTAEKSGFAVAQAAKVLTKEQREKLDLWEVEESFI